MNNAQYIGYPDFLKYSKKIGRRFAIPLQRAQEMFSRVCGFGGMYELQKHVQGNVPAPSVTLEIWVARLRAEFGSDLDELVPEDERARWFRYIYRDHSV